MKKILLLLFIIPIWGFCQNYEFIKLDGTYLFGNWNAYRIDSVKVSDSGQLFYSYKRVYSIIDDYEGVIDPLTTWLGDQVLLANNGSTSFYNWDNHPFLFYSEYPANQEWQVFEYENGDILRAHFLEQTLYQEVLPNLYDSVKNIRFQLYNITGEAVESQFNEDTLILSKNQGMLNPYSFVKIDVDNNKGLIQYSLTGIEKEYETFGQDYFYDDIVSSLSVGSCMHFLTYPQGENLPANIRRYVVGKQVSNSYVTYQFVDTSYYKGAQTVHYFSRKFNRKLLPYQSQFDSDSLGFQGYMQLDTYGVDSEWGNKRYYNFHDWDGEDTEFQDDYAWFVDYWELNQGNYTVYHFTEGIGIIVVSAGNDFLPDNIVYYKNSEEEWGEPLDVGPYSYNGDFQIFREGISHYLKKGPEWGPIRDIHGMRIDSVKNTEDLMIKKYFNYRTPEEYKYNEMTYFNPSTSWLGDYTLLSDSGFAIVINQYGDSILFNSGTEWGMPSWEMFKFPNGNKVIASYDNIIEQDIYPGLSDVVCSIYFEVTDSVGNFVNHSLNNKTLRLSKKYGLLDLFNFSKFPDIDIYYNIGIEVDGVSYGWENNFDEQVNSFESGALTDYYYSDLALQEHKIRRKVLSKEVNYSAIEFIENHCEEITTKDSVYIVNYVDTSVFVMNTMPRQTIFDATLTGHQQFTEYVKVDSVDICGRKSYFAFNNYYKIAEIELDGRLLWEMNPEIFLEEKPSLRFIEHIGLNSSNRFGEQVSDTIKFFDNGLESCGIPYGFECATGINELEGIGFLVSPNPNNGVFEVSFSSNQNIEELKLLNTQGELVWCARGNNENSIDIINQPAGLYILQIVLKSGKYVNEKIIIQK